MQESAFWWTHGLSSKGQCSWLAMSRMGLPPICRTELRPLLRHSIIIGVSLAAT